MDELARNVDFHAGRPVDRGDCLGDCAGTVPARHVVDFEGDHCFLQFRLVVELSTLSSCQGQELFLRMVFRAADPKLGRPETATRCGLCPKDGTFIVTVIERGNRAQPAQRALMQVNALGRDIRNVQLWVVHATYGQQKEVL
jgi:hypothetical protein